MVSVGQDILANVANTAFCKSSPAAGCLFAILYTKKKLE
jgi:hypothetical protein